MLSFPGVLQDGTSAVRLKRLVPWWAKIAGKLLLSRMPASYHFWQRMNLFVHGDMVNPAYALGVVQWHLDRVGWPDLTDRTVLELGPGDSLATAVIASALGAYRAILVDVGAFATRDTAQYVALAEYLRQKGLVPPDLLGCSSLEEILHRCNASYLSNGVESLRTISGHSVDFVFSHAVLEHLRKQDVTQTLHEMLRLIKPEGIASHKIDLSDHLGGGLNNLRFSEDVWEAEWMARSGFYTNRIRFGEMCDLFRQTGFSVEVVGKDKFACLPTPRQKLSTLFSSLPEEDLLVRGFDVLLRPHKGVY